MEENDYPPNPREYEAATLVLTVFPGRLGISASFVPGRGARVSHVDPACEFREYIRAGDTIVSVDDKRVESLGDLLVGKDRVRNFGIVRRSTDDVVDDEFAKKFGEIASQKKDGVEGAAGAAPTIADGDGATAAAKGNTTKSNDKKKRTRGPNKKKKDPNAPKKKRGPRGPYKKGLDKKKKSPALPVIKVQPGRLGIGVVLREGVGARVTYVDPKGPLRDSLSVGDAIVTIDGHRVQSLLHFDLGKDREREFGVERIRPENVPDAGEASSAGDPPPKKKKKDGKKKGGADPPIGADIAQMADDGMRGLSGEERRRRQVLLAELAQWDKKTSSLISKRSGLSADGAKKEPKPLFLVEDLPFTGA